MTKKRRFFCRGLAALLTVALCCGPLSLTAAARETHVFSRWPQDVPPTVRDGWKDPQLEQTTTAELNKILESLASAAEANAPAAEVTALYEQAQEELFALQINSVFAAVACRQSGEYEAEDARWQAALENGERAFAEAERLLFSGAYQAEFREKLGDAYIDAVLSKPDGRQRPAVRAYQGRNHCKGAAVSLRHLQ